MIRSGILAAVLGLSALAPSPQAKTIKDIMDKTHKASDSVVARVRDGEGTAEDHKKALAIYKSLAALKPAMGDDKAWKNRTGAVISALQDMVDKKSGAVDRFRSVTACRGCHDAHRPNYPTK